MAQEQMPHRLALLERKKLTVTGVAEVISFEDTSVILQTGDADRSGQHPPTENPLAGGRTGGGGGQHCRADL